MLAGQSVLIHCTDDTWASYHRGLFVNCKWVNMSYSWSYLLFVRRGSVDELAICEQVNSVLSHRTDDTVQRGQYVIGSILQQRVGQLVVPRQVR